MLFKPQKYSIPDREGENFIDPAEIRAILATCPDPTVEQVREVVANSLSRERLSLQQAAVLLNARGQEQIEIILSAAERLKKEVYGERIVIFAPLYVGNRCVNNCAYCGFRADNPDAVRRTLSDAELAREVEELEKTGQRRLILVYGEHPAYSPEYIAHTVRLTYQTHAEGGMINRVNINAAPFDVEGFRTIAASGIGTYQIFQETYDPDLYLDFHGPGPKRDYTYRVTALDRAMQAGIDDVGLGVLFGLGDWRYEVMALVRHTNHLEACFGVGPHTISFPRIQNASNLDKSRLTPVSDDDFTLLVAILRLAVPYTGLIMTAREPHQLRDRLIRYGVSQIDAGTKLEIGGYSEGHDKQRIEREQFELSDTRTLLQTVEELVGQGRLPSFCTACYRKGRTGEHFMEFSTKGFIKRFCTPNALITFAEYLADYAPEDLRRRGWELIERQLAEMDESEIRSRTAAILEDIKKGKRDMLL